MRTFAYIVLALVVASVAHADIRLLMRARGYEQRGAEWRTVQPIDVADHKWGEMNWGDGTWR